MIKIFESIEQLNLFAAEKFVEIAEQAIKRQRHSRMTVALAGGSTPKSLYRLLAGDQFRDKIDWRRVKFFFGDERNVLPDDADSNFRMANENLLQPLQIEDENIYRWQTELQNAEQIAAEYASEIEDFFESNQPRFDLILLGMGADGHTASLFPFTDALHETEKIAVVNRVEKLDTTRFTLTFPIINNARNVIFLVKGADKAEVLRDVLQGEPQPDKLPSQNVKPQNGELFWLLDDEAAEFLK